MARRFRFRMDRRFVISAVAAGIGLAVLGHHGVATPAAAFAPSARGGTLDCSGLERLWEDAGGPPSAANLAASVAMAESSGRQYAANYNGNGTVDRGYWQINSTWGALSTFGSYRNARAAVQISNDGSDFSPWVTYTTGAYAGRC